MRHFIEVRNKYLAVADPDKPLTAAGGEIKKLVRTAPI